MAATYGTHGRLGVAVATALALLAVAVWVGGGSSSAGSAVAAQHDGGQETLAAYEDMPLAFVENQGQTDARVRYHGQGAGYAFFFTPEEVVLSLAPGAAAVPAATVAEPVEGVVLALRFVGGNPDVVVEGGERAPGAVNYLRGDDPAGWQIDLPGYVSVVYRELWPGIDAVLREHDGTLKYEFRVRPGADPADVRLAYAGGDGLVLDDDGGLLLSTPLGTLRDAPPVSYQVIDGARVPVDSRYVLGHGGEYAFAVDGYRPGHELVIDPGLDYSTFLGGSSHEQAAGIAVDAGGNAYVVGTTQSDDFPTTTGAFDQTFNGGVVDVFVAKLTADGSGLVYATYLGGTPTPLRRGTGDPFEFGRGIAIDADGHAYVTGQTTSSDFPTTAGAFQEEINVRPLEERNDATDGFVTKLNPTGSGLVYSTFLGGTNFEDTDGIAIDAAGNAYVTGRTHSTDFPTTIGAVQTSLAGGADGFVTKLNAQGSDVVYSTYLGGTDNEVTENVVVDADGSAYVVGSTRSQDFPSTPGAFMPNHPGGEFADLFTVFAVKLNSTGTDLVYSTFLGGTKRDGAAGLAVDLDGNAHVTGGTLSPEFPTTAGAYDTVFDGTSEAFTTKLNADGSGLVYSTFLNGGSAATVALDADNNAWLGGGAGANAPTTPDAFQPGNNGGTDAWLGQLSVDGSDLLHGTFIGGANSERIDDIALDGAGAIYVAGTTFSPGFPTTVGAFDRTFDGDPSIFWGDAFVAKFGDGSGDTAPPPAESSETVTFSGEIDKNATVTHTVAIEATGTVDMNLDWNESRVNLSLRARDPSGNVVFLDSSSSKPKSGSFSATVTGDYRFDVINNTDRKTDYTLSVTYPVASSPPPADTTAPTVSISSPVDGNTVSGTVSVAASASDDVGVTEVRFFVDGALIGSDTTDPYAVSWNTTTVADGSRVLTASAVDGAGNVGESDPVTVTVDNSEPTVALSSLGLSPTSVAGGDSSTGTVTLTAAAPSGGASVALTSSNTDVATVPVSVTVPAGATSATFTVSTSNVTADSSSAISATYGGVTDSVILSVTAPENTDTVSITRAEYTSSKNELRVEASSSVSGATLSVYVTATDEFIGTLSGGRGEFSWPTNPEDITVRSSLGGSATSSVTLK